MIEDSKERKTTSVLRFNKKRYRTGNGCKLFSEENIMAHIRHFDMKWDSLNCDMNMISD